MPVGLVLGMLVMNLDVPCVHGGIRLTTLISFAVTNGAKPSAGLVQGPDGAFYGTTQTGGSSSLGTLFKITSAGAFSNLLTFTGTGGAAPGANPAASLIWGPDGNLYGTTFSGGASNCGTVFEVTTNGVFTTLISFTGTNGARPGAAPAAGLAWGPNGALYGTTQLGGTNDLLNGGDGTVFEVTTNGGFTSLISFTGTNGSHLGAEPSARLMLGKDGNFYGTTQFGGTNDLLNGGDGTIFRMTSTGTLTTLVSFNYVAGANPQAGLVQGADGNCYGTAYYGGGQGAGTIFKMTPLGVVTVLVSLDYANGANPYADLVQGMDGNLYGATQVGGMNNCGTVFQMTPAGALTSLVSFDGTNGRYPVAGLVQGADGNFYGTTASGTTSPQGTVYRFPPPPVFLKWWQSDQAMAFNWSSATGQVYQIQFKTNASQTGWSNLGGTVTATNASMTASDGVGSSSLRIYRIGLLP